MRFYAYIALKTIEGFLAQANWNQSHDGEGKGFIKELNLFPSFLCILLLSPIELSDVINIHSQPLSVFSLHLFPKLSFHLDLFQTDYIYVSIMVLFKLEILQ